MSKKTESLDDLKRIATVKHGENWAWCLAKDYGNVRHKESWRKAIAHPARTPEEVLDHQVWQQEIQNKYFGKTFPPQS